MHKFCSDYIGSNYEKHGLTFEEAVEADKIYREIFKLLCLKLKKNQRDLVMSLISKE